MTIGEAKQLLPIIQAFAEGRPIQYRMKDIKSAKWNDIYKNYHEFSPHSFQYRIKPEPMYRPFKDEKECWQEMQKHQPIGWTYDYTNNIWDSIARVTGSGIVYEEDMMCFEDVFNRVKFADGTPFGVKIKE